MLTSHERGVPRHWCAVGRRFVVVGALLSSPLLSSPLRSAPLLCSALVSSRLLPSTHARNSLNSCSFRTCTCACDVRIFFFACYFVDGSDVLRCPASSPSVSCCLTLPTLSCFRFAGFGFWFFRCSAPTHFHQQSQWSIECWCGTSSDEADYERHGTATCDWACS